MKMVKTTKAGPSHMTTVFSRPLTDGLLQNKNPLDHTGSLVIIKMKKKVSVSIVCYLLHHV